MKKGKLKKLLKGVYLGEKMKNYYHFINEIFKLEVFNKIKELIY